MQSKLVPPLNSRVVGLRTTECASQTQKTAIYRTGHVNVIFTHYTYALLYGVQDVLQLRQQMSFIVADINSTYMLIANRGNGNIPGRFWTWHRNVWML
jgi:hypothetical protein